MVDTVETAVYKLAYDAGMSKQSVDEVKRSLDALLQTTEQTSASEEKLNRATRTSADGMDRLLGRLDPAVRAQQDYERAIQRVARLQSEGIGTTEQAARAIKLAGDRLHETTEALDGPSSFNKALTLGSHLLGAFGVALSVDAVVNWGREVAKSTADLDNASKRIGVSTDALQAWRASAIAGGASADIADSAILRFTRSIGEASEQTGAARHAFQQLGLTATDLAGGSERVLPKVATALLAIHDASERARIEVALFGKSGQETENVLSGWSTETDKLVQHFKDLGFVIDSSVIERAAKADAAWNAFWLRMKAGAASVIFPPTAQERIANEFATGSREQLLNSPRDLRKSGIPFASAASPPIDWTSQSHELQNYLDKLKAATAMAAELPRQRAIDQALIAAAAAAEKDYVAQLEASGASQNKINAAKAIEVNSVDQAKAILGDKVAKQIEEQTVLQRINAEYAVGLQRLDEIRTASGAVNLLNDKLLKTLEEQNKQKVDQRVKDDLANYWREMEANYRSAKAALDAISRSEKDIEYQRALQSLRGAPGFDQNRVKEALGSSPLQRDLNTVDKSLGGDRASAALEREARAVEQERLNIIKDAQEAEMISREEAAQRRVEIERTAALEISAIYSKAATDNLGLAASGFDRLAEATEGFAGKQSTVYKALFATSKAFAIAESIIKGQQALAEALALPFPANIPAMAAVAAEVANILSAIQAVSATGFRLGGYTGDGPTSAISGVVHGQEFVVNAEATRRNRAALDAMNAGRAPANDNGMKVTVVNNTPSRIEVRQLSENDVRIIVHQEAPAIVHAEGPRMMEREMSDQNSRGHQAIVRNTTARSSRR